MKKAKYTKSNRLSNKKINKKDFFETSKLKNFDSHQKQNVFEKYNYIIVIFLLLIFFIQATTSMINKSPTVDEPSHIFSGYSYITKWDIKRNIEHPIFVKLLISVPVKALNPKLPSDYNTTSSYDELSTQNLGQKFFYENRENNLNYKILFWSRFMIVLLGLLLGIYVYKFANFLFGIKSGLLALFLYSFSSNILAHTRLVTTDLALACFGTIFVYYLCKYKAHLKIGSIIAAGIFLGIALISKYSAVLFLPILLLLLFLKAGAIKRSKQFYIKNLLAIVYICIIALFIVHLTYGFEKINFNYIIPLPETYSAGLQLTHGHSQAGHYTFLAGMHSLYAWPYYIITAFLIKTPITIIIFFIISIILFISGLIKKENIQRELFLILPILIFFIFFSFFTKKVLGLRYILPIYPFIFIMCGNLINLKSGIFKIIILILSVFYLISSLIIYPHYLSYFNEFTGIKGENGYKYLIDSNLDWAQNHFLLEKYLQKQEFSDLKMNLFYYFQFSDYKLPKHENIPCNYTSGTLIISTTQLQGLFEPDTLHEKNCYSWLRKHKPVDKIGKSIFIYQI